MHHGGRQINMLRAIGNALLQKTSQAKRKITEVRGTVL
jgi:hypothetical protein